MAIKDDELLSAISSGIDNGEDTELPQETAADESETPDTGAEPGSAPVDDGEGGASEGTGAQDGVELDAEGNPIAKEPAKEPAGDEPPVGADGKPLVGAALAAHNAKKANAPKEGAAPVAVKKDPINDPIPKELKKETQERMVSLVNVAKDLTAKLNHVTAQQSSLMSAIQESRATPEQYNQALTYMRLVNSGDPANLEKCIQFMQNELVALCRMTGKSVPGVDLLAGHKDLTEAVANGTISQQHAEELANARTRNAYQQSAVQKTQTDRQRAAAAHQQGIEDLNALEAELAQNDPEYKLKRPQILERLRAKDPQTGKSLIQSTPPSRWEALFLKHYGLAKVAPKAPAARTPGGTAPKNQPLRASNPAGSQAKAPSSLSEAIDFGIASAGKR